jgi:small-conductance mechanosensitive channel
MQTTSEIKAMMLASKEKEIQQQGKNVDEQIAVTEAQLAQLASTSNDSQGQGNEKTQLELIDDIRQQRSLLYQYRQMCKEAQSKTHNECAGQNIKQVTLSQSHLLVGIINADGEELNFKQSIEDVSAKDNSFGVVGIARNIDTTAFFRRF